MQSLFSGLTTLELSKILYTKIIFNIAIEFLYNVSGKKINKYDLLKKIKKIYNKNITIKKENKFNIDRSLDSSRFIRQTGYVKKTWNKMILKNKNYFLRHAK